MPTTDHHSKQWRASLLLPAQVKMGGGLVPLLFLWLFVLSGTALEIQKVSFSIAVNQPGRAFQQFITDMRAMLRVPDRPYVLNETGRLPAQEDTPTRFINFELRTAELGITLWMRVDNLYVIGFRSGIDEGTWYQFSDYHLIPGATQLTFGSRYGGQGIPNVDVNTPLGRPNVEVAIDELSAHGNNGAIVDDETLKSHLRTLIVHFVEAMRFTPIAEAVQLRLAGADEDASAPPGTMGIELATLVNEWSTLSNVLYDVVNEVIQDPTLITRRLGQLVAFYNIYDAAGVARVLGLALLKNHHNQHNTNRRPRRSVQDNADHVYAGLDLIQVIDVIVRRIDDEDPGDLYGSITIQDSIGSQQLFNRDRSDTQSVHPGGKAQLTGPDRGMSAADNFEIKVDLMDKDSDPSPDDKVSNGYVDWNSFVVTSDRYDVLQSSVIDGASGQVELRYAVLTDATLATVEVVILDSSEDTPNVYGAVSAGMVLDDGTGVSFELMGLTRDQQVGVPKGSAVPLQRKIVAVRMSSPFQVGVVLSDSNSFSEDEEIANGLFTFPTPRLDGEDSGEVTGKKGRVKVRVTWSSWFPSCC